MPIIEVNHVTKEYRLGVLHNFKHTLQDLGARLRGERIPKPAPFKALDDVDFKVEEGEVLGIIGHNGAGKSTLLKHLAGITTPTKGNVVVRGKVAPLIEVGAGLIGDLTGRENIYLNATILGLKRKEIDRKFDEIVAFAELEEFIDTPIKRYSSGMSVRLGFSIATSVEADILIVDEVLAVGDLAFQRKCFDRMEGLIKKQGKTVLLVSHNLRQVERLCHRTILIDHGRVVADDDSKSVCNQFYSLSDEKIASSQPTQKKSIFVELKSILLYGSDGQESNLLIHGQSVRFVMTFEIKREIIKPIFGLSIHTTDMLYLTANVSEGYISEEILYPGIYVVSCDICEFLLLPGKYSLRVSLKDSTGTDFFYGENLVSFLVSSKKINRAHVTGQGFFSLDIDWNINTSKFVA